MKKKILRTLLPLCCAMVCIFGLVACNGHRHTFNMSIIRDEYLKSEATCQSKAIYYFACECGEKGTETFTYGEFASHDYSGGHCVVCQTEQPVSEWLEFDLSDDGQSYAVRKGYCDDTQIRIPEVYEGKPVTKISSYGFQNAQMTSLLIPDSIVGIERFAFRGCDRLKSLTIPSSVTRIGAHLLERSNSLERITVAADNPKYKSENNCLLTKDGKTLLCGCKNSIIPNGVTAIDDYAFDYCETVTNITIPDSVKNVGYAFAGCNGLLAITIGCGVTTIDKNAFLNCNNLERITVAADNPEYKSESNCLLTKDGKTLVLGCKNSIIPLGVTAVGVNAFWGRRGLTDIVIPSSVTEIGENAFRSCSDFTSVTIPENVVKISSDAFIFCGSVTIYCEAINAPKDFDHNWNGGNPVVWDCENNDKDVNGYVYTVVGALKYVIKDGKAEVYASISTASGEINIPAAIAYKGQKYSVTGIRSISASGITSVTIPDSIKSISASVFAGCKSLISVSIGSGVTDIVYGAFACGNLESITVAENNSVYTSKDGILYNKAKTEILRVPNGIKGDIAIPESITSLEWNSFQGCTRLTGITIPRSVTKISQTAFHNCVSLERITVAADNPEYKSENNCLLTKDGKTLVLGCVNSVIPSEVTKIGDSAFSGAARFVTVTIPNGITELGHYAFGECEGLTSVTIPSSVKLINANAFFCCSGLKEIVYSGTKAQWDDVIKNADWDFGTRNFPVRCTDGDITKNERTE